MMCDYGIMYEFSVCQIVQHHEDQGRPKRVTRSKVKKPKSEEPKGRRAKRAKSQKGEEPKGRRAKRAKSQKG